MLSGLRKDNTGYDLGIYLSAPGHAWYYYRGNNAPFSEASCRRTRIAEVRDVDAAVELLHRAQATSGGMVEAFELILQTFCMFY